MVSNIGRVYNMSRLLKTILTCVSFKMRDKFLNKSIVNDLLGGYQATGNRIHPADVGIKKIL